MKAISIIALSLFTASAAVHAVPAQPTPTQAPVVAKTAKSSKINLNTADVTTLSHSFKGIGAKRAEAIVAYRQSHQGFKTIEELAEVKGFGKKFIAKNIEKLKEIFSVS